ncbi:MAG: hypothetical protein M3282_10830, partial [Gemmatimonadota bacterium]|nr:hypothetical protein [Gemmatimonadota bacterium]
MPRTTGVRRPAARAWALVGVLTAVVAALVVVVTGGGSGPQGGRSLMDALPRRGGRPDELPVMLNR